MEIKDIIAEGLVSIREIEPGAYVVQTEKGWDRLKDDIASGKVWGGWHNYTPDWIRELNRKHADEIRKYNPEIDKII